MCEGEQYNAHVAEPQGWVGCVDDGDDDDDDGGAN